VLHRQPEQRVLPVKLLLHHEVREVYVVRDVLALERELQQVPSLRALYVNQ
jgi:hypothetical protein